MLKYAKIIHIGMKAVKIAVAVLGLAALGMASPLAAMASGHTQESGMQHTIITIVCTIYSDHMDDTISGMDLALGLNLGQFMSDCEITAEYVEALSASVDVAVIEGSLYPTCAESDDCFDPHTITIEPRTAVTWTNHDTVLHTVTETKANPEFDVWLLPGEEHTITFDTLGTYVYGCTVHPWASGVVIVSDSAGAMAEDTTEPAIEVVEEQVVDDEAVYQLVDDTIALYEEEGTDAFETITGMATNLDQDIVVFVVDTNTNALVAHSLVPQYVGLNVEPVLDAAFMPLEVMLDIIASEEDGVWLTYPSADTQGNLIGYDRGWMKMYGEYVFVGRYGVDIEERVQSITDEMIRLYKWNPDTVFDTITGFMSVDESYPFVIDLDTERIVAHGSNPDRIGEISVVTTDSTVSLEEFRDLEDGEGIWTEYTFNNPVTSMEESKRSWIVSHDGYLFGSGYYP